MISKYCSTECCLNRNKRIGEDGVHEKQCSKCGEWKPMTPGHFHRVNLSADGFAGHCKSCASQKAKTPEARASQAASKNRRAEKIKQYNKEYRRRKSVKKRNNEREAMRAKTDPAFALKRRMRVLMYHSLRNNKGGRKWEELVGYSVEDLRRHIEKKFKKGMNWERFMAGEVHIDHKIPLAAHHYETPEDIDFKRAWSLKNLQPLWAAENISKGDNVYKPFQPSLNISIEDF
jgi:hypothetical protein